MHKLVDNKEFVVEPVGIWGTPQSCPHLHGLRSFDGLNDCSY